LIKESAASVDKNWREYPAEEWSDALVAAMKLGGIDNLYFVSGTELGFYQEACAKAAELGRPAPQLRTMVHEGVALNAALGEIMVTGKPAAAAAHVDVGLLNYGAGIHTAFRCNYPVLITSGTGPRAYQGSMPGARDNGIQWVQEPRDQGEILRQYTKADHRLEHQDNPGLMVSRLLQIAVSEPQGPVYMALPRESAMLPLPGKTRFPTMEQLGVARPVAPTDEDARTVARWLIEADNPIICTARSGRISATVEALVRLSELLGLPVNDNRLSNSLNFPHIHPHYGTGPALKNADAVLVIESPVPWLPADGPTPEAVVAWIEQDPVQSRYKTMEFQADLWLPVDTTAALDAIFEAATHMLSASDRSRIEERKARLDRRKQEMRAAAEQEAQQARGRNPLDRRWVSYQISQILEPDAILLDDALSNSDYMRIFSNRSQPGTYFKRNSSTGGWGSGAAVGAKIAAPDRDVVLASGDGFFMFGSPLEALWAASYHKAPFLSVIFTNRSYSTGVNTLHNIYPEGTAAQTGYVGGTFDPPPDFGKLAETVGGYGETVSEADEVGPALKRGLDAVHNGAPAVISVWLPTLVEELQMAGRH